MAKKELYAKIVLGLLLISMFVLATYQPVLENRPAAAQGFDASPYEAFSCPVLWDTEGGLYTIETGVQTEEADARDQAP